MEGLQEAISHQPLDVSQKGNNLMANSNSLTRELVNKTTVLTINIIISVDTMVQKYIVVVM